LLFLNIVSVIQLRRVRRARRVASMEEFILVDNSGEKSGKKHWGDLENDGKIFCEDLCYKKSNKPLNSCHNILCPVKARGIFIGE